MMVPDKRDGLGGPSRLGRIPVPPFATPDASKTQATSTKSGIPSPRRRTVGGVSRLKDATPVSAIPASTTASSKRPVQTAISKITKALLRPGSSHDDKDDTRQHKDATKKDSLQRDKPIKDLSTRRPTSTSEAGSAPDSGKRVFKQPASSSEPGSNPDSGKRFLKQPSLLLKSGATAAASPARSGGGASKATAPAAAEKVVPRSISTCRDRLSSDTRASIMRRSMSVGKGRSLTSPMDPPPQQQAGARMRPIIERPASAAGAPYRHFADRRDTSAGRIRPISASGKIEASVATSSKPALRTIAEAPARLAPSTTTGATGTPTKPTPSKPVFALNLSALKQQTAPPPPPAPEPEPSASNASEDSGPPVPKLDLGGILQRRAEEQASEPVFVVAQSSDDGEQASGSASQGGHPDKRKSESRQTSAKEEPAEHFYLYPKVQPQEKKRIEDMCRVVPKKQQVAITDLFSKMVEARQNCEQMCFRGHRLLDQAQAEFRNRLAQKDEEVAQTKEEAAQWRQEAEYLRAQLALLLGPRQTDEATGDDQAHKNTQEAQEAASEEERAACLRDSLLSTFDNMAQLCAEAAAAAETEAQRGDVQDGADG